VGIPQVNSVFHIYLAGRLEGTLMAKMYVRHDCDEQSRMNIFSALILPLRSAGQLLWTCDRTVQMSHDIFNVSQPQETEARMRCTLVQRVEQAGAS
jgi:hypothetical protein